MTRETENNNLLGRKLTAPDDKMGDRANIVIENDGECFKAPLFIYTHWRGYEIKSILRNTLERGRGRWSDPPYLARIIFSEMIKDSVLDENGYGLSNVYCDGSYNLLCVNIKEQKVRERGSHSNPDAKVINEWTFEEFAALNFKEEEAEA